jgi:hypothetical protein
LPAHLLVGDHGDRRIVGVLHAGLEDERDLHDDRPRRRHARLSVRTPGGDPPAHPRPEVLLEPRALGRVRERVRRDRIAVDRPFRRDVRAPPLDDRIADLVGPVELVHDRVGGQRGGAKPLEGRERGRLAGADAAGERDERGATTAQSRRAAALA